MVMVCIIAFGLEIFSGGSRLLERDVSVFIAAEIVIAGALVFWLVIVGIHGSATVLQQVIPVVVVIVYCTMSTDLSRLEHQTLTFVAGVLVFTMLSQKSQQSVILGRRN